jgi:hypothetical protein
LGLHDPSSCAALRHKEPRRPGTERLGGLTLCCSKLWTSVDCLDHTVERLRRVCKVLTQTDRPRPSVKIAQETTSQPCARSQPLLCGRKSAGSERRKVTKMKTAFTTPAVHPVSMATFLMVPNCHITGRRHFFLVEGIVPVKGHWSRRRFCATVLTVGLARIVSSDIREKPSSRPPQAAKRTSMPTNTIMSLVGMLARGWRSSLRRARKEWREEAYEEPSGALSQDN